MLFEKKKKKNYFRQAKALFNIFTKRKTCDTIETYHDDLNGEVVSNAD
jgi:hypothetical protein